MAQKNLLQSAGDGTAVPAGYVGETTVKTGSFGPLSAGTNTTTIYTTTIAAGIYLIVGNVNVTWSAAPSVSNFTLLTISGGVKTINCTRLPAKPSSSSADDSFPVIGSFVSTGSNSFILSGTNFSSGASITFGVDLNFVRIA